MKLNWAERLVVNNPLRVMEQRLQVEWLRRVRPLPSGATVLEIGCGRGAGARLILEAFGPATIHASDLDVLMIRHARRFLTPRERQRISLFAAEAERLPYPDGSLDAVFDFGVLHHIPDWRAAVKEIARVVKPGGAFYVEELYPTLYQNFITRHILLHPTEDRFKSRDFRKELESSGFSFQESREIPGVGILAVLVKGE